MLFSSASPRRRRSIDERDHDHAVQLSFLKSPKRKASAPNIFKQLQESSCGSFEAVRATERMQLVSLPENRFFELHILARWEIASSEKLVRPDPSVRFAVEQHEVLTTSPKNAETEIRRRRALEFPVPCMEMPVSCNPLHKVSQECPSIGLTRPTANSMSVPVTQSAFSAV